LGLVLFVVLAAVAPAFDYHVGCEDEDD